MQRFRVTAEPADWADTPHGLPTLLPSLTPGCPSLGNHMVSAGLPLAGQRLTLRLDGPVAHILSGGILARTIACPVPHDARSRLRGARAGTAQPPRIGLAHARKTAEVTVEADAYQITVEPGITITATPHHQQ